MHGRIRTIGWELGPLLLLVVLIALWGRGVSESLQQTIVTALVDLVLVVGLYSFVGLTGVVSFGNMAFGAIGAYTYGLATLPGAVKQVQLPDLPGPLAHLHLAYAPAIVVSGLVAAAFAAITGPALMRLSGLAAGLATVSLLVITRVVAQNWTQVTKGTSGLAGLPTDTSLSAATVTALLCIALVYGLQNSRLGLRLRASREDDVSSRSVGVAVVRVRWASFTISGFVTGIGGALFAGVLGLVTPDQFFLSATFITIAMLVIGGRCSLAGAVIGSLAVSFLAELLRHVEQGVVIGGTKYAGRAGIADVALSLVLVLLLIFRPDGLTGGRELRPPRARSARSIRRRELLSPGGLAEAEIDTVGASQPAAREDLAVQPAARPPHH